MFYSKRFHCSSENQFKAQCIRNGNNMTTKWCIEFSYQTMSLSDHAHRQNTKDWTLVLLWDVLGNGAKFVQKMQLVILLL